MMPRTFKMFSKAVLHGQVACGFVVLCAAASAQTLNGTEGRTASQIAADPSLAFVQRLEPYRPSEHVHGTISLWGHGSFKRDFMGKVVHRWMAEFQRQQPDVHFEYKMYGSASAIGALYTGAGNLSILGEEISPAAAKTFLRAKGYAPTEVDVATGSLDVNGYDFAHMIFVNKDNPLRSLSVPQLKAIFGANPGAGARRIRTWGELGLTGEWADKPIQTYGWKTDVDFGYFFRERVLGGDHRWNPNIKEFVHGTKPDGTQYDWGERILDAVSPDRYGMALATVRFPKSQVRVVPLSWKQGGPAVEPTNATLISQAYPLTRIIPAYFDQPPGKPVDPVVREFLRYLLSREGQLALIEDSDYLPLGAEPRARQLEKLK